MKKLIIFLLVILLAGCTAQQCPQLNCPVCSCPEVKQETKSIVFAYFIDVGEGDAILIKSGETEMLIDCGKNADGPKVVDFLKAKNIGDLEYLLITHPDSDHLGGCDDVLKAFKTHSVITNGEEADTNSYKEVKAELDTEQHIIASKGNSWNIGPAELRVIQAQNGLSDSNQNSIVTKLTYGSIDILLTGDCDRECEDSLLSRDIASEILKVTHHGSKFGTEIDFLQVVHPQIAIISVGQNSYGHPTPETIDRLTQEGISIYRTDTSGDITVSINGESYEIIA